MQLCRLADLAGDGMGKKGGAMSRDEEETVEFEDVFIKAATPKAVLCEIDGTHRWIPQSQVHENSEIWRTGDEGKLVIRRWFAEKAGLV